MKTFLWLKSKFNLTAFLTSGFLLAIFIIAYAARSDSRDYAPTSAKGIQVQSPTLASKAVYVSRGRLGSRLAPMLDVLGNRFERAGNERTVMLGTLARPNVGSATIPIRLFLERPGRVRLEQQIGTRVQVTIFDAKDGKEISKDGANPTLEENDEIETLAFDGVDRFLLGRMDGIAIRFIGARFRADDGQAQNYAGPYYDVYQTVDQVGVTKELRMQPKFHLFNSRTQLLEFVRYENMVNRVKNKVEIRYENWQRLNAQLIPTQITRLVNGAPTMRLLITEASFGPSLPDGIFDR